MNKRAKFFINHSKAHRVGHLERLFAEFQPEDFLNIQQEI